MKSKNLIITAAMLSAVGLTTLGVSAIHAATTNTSSANPMSNLVNAIATKFNLNAADVQQVFDDQHAQMDAQRKQSEADRLAQAVTDGKLTQAQADLIIAKKAELDAQREADRTAMDGKTEAERRTAMEAERTALQKWATDNNIPMEYLMFGGPMGGRGFHGGMEFGHRMMDDSTSTTNQ